MTGANEKAMWLNYGQFHCDEHRSGIPFGMAPQTAVCAECTGDADDSYLKQPRPIQEAK